MTVRAVLITHYSTEARQCQVISPKKIFKNLQIGQKDKKRGGKEIAKGVKRCEVNIELVMKVAGVGMIVTVVCQILSKAGRDEQSALVSISGIVIILVALVEEIGGLLGALREIFGL